MNKNVKQQFRQRQHLFELHNQQLLFEKKKNQKMTAILLPKTTFIQQNL
jgi:hypothetical protein